MNWITSVILGINAGLMVLQWRSMTIAKKNRAETLNLAFDQNMRLRARSEELQDQLMEASREIGRLKNELAFYKSDEVQL